MKSYLTFANAKKVLPWAALVTCAGLAVTQLPKIEIVRHYTGGATFSNLWQNGGSRHYSNDAIAQEGTPDFWFNEGQELWSGEVYEYEKSAQAVELFKKAAAQNHREAQYALAFAYQEGRGVPTNPTLAIHWYTRAAEESASAQFTLGLLYYVGREVEIDKAKGVYYLTKAAEQNHAEAQFMLGAAYELGGGIRVDLAKARHWFKKAADQGHPKARFALEQVEKRGGKGGLFPQSASEVVEYTTEFDQQDDPEALFILGITEISGKNVKEMSKGIGYLKRAAEMNNGKAQFTLGSLCEKGIGFPKDEAKAAEWYAKAAANNNSDGLTQLGAFYLDGRGVPQNDYKGVELLKRAVQMDHPGATYYLGLCYKLGRGVEKNEAKGLELMKKGKAMEPKNRDK